MGSLNKNIILILIFLIVIISSCKKPIKDVEAEITCKPLDKNPANQINPGLTKNDGNVVFVTMFGCGNGDGSNWVDATSMAFLRNIANLSANTKDGKKINKIFLRVGYYKPTEDVSDNSAAFDAPPLTAAADAVGGVEIVGGFRGDTSDSKLADPVKYKVYFCGRAASKSIDDDCSDGSNTNRIFSTVNPFKLTNVYIKGSGAVGDGGAINGTSIVLNNVTFVDNSAGGYGGSLSAQDIVVKNSTFKGNHGQIAGAIYGVNVGAFNTTFISNTAKYGGALLANRNIMVVNSNFFNNAITDPSNSDSGAAIYLYYQGNQLKGLIVNSNFTGHTGTPIPTIWGRLQNTLVMVNNIIYDNANNIFYPPAGGNIDQWPTNSIIKGGYKPANDVLTNIYNVDPKLLATQTIANAVQNNSYNMLDASSTAINNGARVWVDTTSSSLNNTVYVYSSRGFSKYIYNATNGSWGTPVTITFSEAVNGHIELTEFDMFKKYRNLLIDIGSVENN